MAKKLSNKTYPIAWEKMSVIIIAIMSEWRGELLFTSIVVRLQNNWRHPCMWLAGKGVTRRAAARAAGYVKSCNTVCLCAVSRSPWRWWSRTENQSTVIVSRKHSFHVSMFLLISRSVVYLYNWIYLIFFQIDIKQLDIHKRGDLAWSFDMFFMLQAGWNRDLQQSSTPPHIQSHRATSHPSTPSWLLTSTAESEGPADRRVTSS